jgi:signal transduction histidine kinase
LAAGEEGHVATEGRDTRREGPDRATTDDGIGQALHEMRDGLTVIHAYAQLLQRRIDPEESVEQETLLNRLAIIEDTAMRMESRLRRLDRYHAGDG